VDPRVAIEYRFEQVCLGHAPSWSRAELPFGSQKGKKEWKPDDGWQCGEGLGGCACMLGGYAGSEVKGMGGLVGRQRYRWVVCSRVLHKYCTEVPVTLEMYWP
jgi:hypothetical protein